MLYGVGDVFDAKVNVKFDNLFIYELSAIVGYDSMRYSIAADNVFPYELLDLLCCDCGQWLSFYPFRKVVDVHNEEFHLSFSRGERSKDVHSPFLVD